MRARAVARHVTHREAHQTPATLKPRPPYARDAPTSRHSAKHWLPVPAMPSELSPASPRHSERDDDDDSLDYLDSDQHDAALADGRSPRPPGGEDDADAERFSEWDDLDELNENVTKANTVRALHFPARAHPRPRPRRSRRVSMPT
jgi:hypothetical protein